MYGVFLGFRLLSANLDSTLSSTPDVPLSFILQSMDVPQSRSDSLSWRNLPDRWLWALANDRRIGSVALLCLSLGPMTFGLFGYHVYLIWAGMTTNENARWSLWKEDIAAGSVYMSMDQGPNGGRRLVRRLDNQLLDSEISSLSRKDSKWRKVSSISEVDNLYDRGFWENLLDLFAGRCLEVVQGQSRKRTKEGSRNDGPVG
ncbi:MAG: palmitoyltransferase swf1 [Watsoniomyces obsoletus]|nr:MAG: palmitoyltransferase swf1 [Watsoniomyces obsoletus]